MERKHCTFSQLAAIYGKVVENKKGKRGANKVRKYMKIFLKMTTDTFMMQIIIERWEKRNSVRKK